MRPIAALSPCGSFEQPGPRFVRHRADGANARACQFYFPVQGKSESLCPSALGTAIKEQLLKRYRDQWLRETYDLGIRDGGPGLERGKQPSSAPEVSM